MQTQGLVAISVYQAVSFLILLIFFLLWRREHRNPFFQFWITGWAALTVYGFLRIGFLEYGGGMTRLASLEFSWFGLACLVASAWEYAGRKVRAPALWTWFAGQGVLLAFLERHAARVFLGVHWFTDIFQSALLVAAGWLFWKGPRTRVGYGGRFLSAVMIVAGFHSLDMVRWPGQALFLERVAFQDVLYVAMGIGMAVHILEASRIRSEDLNDKLRRLTLITAASTQSFNVDQMLGVVLHHLVESLNATHGLIRLVSGSGEDAELAVRAAIGYSDAYLLEHERISVKVPWVRRALQQGQPYMALDPQRDVESLTQMREEKPAAAVLVRLPGPDAALGWIFIGSTLKRRFHRDEITFLINVANLLALTVQSVRLFEQVATVQQQWANTFDSIDDPILVHNPEGRIVRVNQAFERRAGKTDEGLIGRQVLGVFQRGENSWSVCPYCEGAAGKGTQTDENLGGYLLASNSQFHDAYGQPLGIIHVLQDITERRAAEEQYRTLIENLQEGVFIATPEGRFVQFNQAFVRMLGYQDREDLMRVEDIGTALYANPVERDTLMRLLREQGSVTNYEFQVRRKDGEIRTMLESSFVTRNESGAMTAYQGFVLDITERKQAEWEIRRRNRELLILNSIGQTLNHALDLHDLLDRVLGQVVGLFGGDQGAIYLLGRDDDMLTRAAAFGMRSFYAGYFPPVPFPPDLLEHVRVVRATVLSEPGPPLPSAFRELQQREGIIVAQWVVLWSSNRPIGLLSLGHRSPRDFSAAELNLLTTVCNQIAIAVEKLQLYEETREAYEDLRRAQEQLLQSEKMAAVGQLVSGVAHELNNPLTAILGYGELLDSADMVSPKGAEFVAKLHKQAQRTHRIVHNLLSFARQHKPERVPVRVNQILEDTLALREYDLRISGIKVHRQFAQDLPQIQADAHQLQQVFLNILNNAVDAVLGMAGRGELWMRTESQGERVRVEIIDNGPGVREPAKVFDPFYTTKPVGKGTGLGLSICYGIVTEHGGEVFVRNIPPRGACFTILLPLTAEAGSPQKPKAADPASPIGVRGVVSEIKP